MGDKGTSLWVSCGGKTDLLKFSELLSHGNTPLGKNLRQKKALGDINQELWGVVCIIIYGQT